MGDSQVPNETAPFTQSHWIKAAFWGAMVVAVAIRAPGIDRPLLGNFATKNVAYAMIARNSAQGTSQGWYPTLDKLAGGDRSLHLLEFPVSAYLTGWLWKTAGGSLDAWGRATSVAFSTASVGLLFLLVRRRHGPAAAVGAAWMLALAPVGIIYGQSFMLEASLVAFALAAIYSTERWSFGGRFGWLALGAACFALLLLTKIYMLVLLLPLAGVVWRADAAWPRRAIAAAAIGLALVPAALWYAHVWSIAAPDGPMAERVYYSIRRSASVHGLPSPLLFSADFYVGVFDDLAGVVLTPVGLIFLAVGFLDRRWRVWGWWLAADAVLLLVLPLKFHEMNYYWLPMLPPLCAVGGLGMTLLWRRLRPGRLALALLLLASVAVTLRYAAKPAWVTPPEDRSVLAAAAATRQLVPEDEPVVTMHGSTIDLLYYCRRTGWEVSLETEHLDRLLRSYQSQGARYLVVAGPQAKAIETMRREKGDRSNLPERPGGCFAQIGPVPFFPLTRAACGDGYRIYRLVDDGN